MGRADVSTALLSEERLASLKERLSVAWVILLGAFLRVVGFSFGYEYLSSRPELVSPLVAFKRLLDGVEMQRDEISPYSGDSVHFPPMMIRLFDIVLATSSTSVLFTCFVVMDCLSGWLLFKSAKYFYRIGGPGLHSYDIDMTVLKCYMLNPVAIASTSIMSMTVVHNLIISSFIYCFAIGYVVQCSVLLSLLTSICLYPIILLGSLVLRFPTKGERMSSIFITLAGFAALLGVNYFLNGFCWNFINNTYGFMLRVDDLTPNSGIFWYFFTQVFEHFRTFYVSVFQINLLVYVIPLMLTVRKDPYLHLIISLILIAVFSPYPTLNDASIYLAFMPALDRYWRQPVRFVLWGGATMVTCIVLMPIMWHLWIVNGSGNANFYFAVSIIYNVAQIYFIVDLLFAYHRCELEVCGDTITSTTKFMFN